jgi:hypothetical protein
MADIKAQGGVDGSATLYAETERAEEWLTEELGESIGLGYGWAVESEFIENLIDLARGEGLTINWV